MLKLPVLRDRRILVTGANGFIGSHLVRKLLECKAVVFGLASPASTLRRIEDVASKINVVRCDLLDLPSLSTICSEICPQIVFHLATYGAYPNQTDMLRMSQTNIFGLTNLLTALHRINFDCFINTGTAVEYGSKRTLMKETDALEPNNFYGATKAASTLLVHAFAVCHRRKMITLRPFYIYGPGEGETRLIRTIIQSCLEGTPLKLTSLTETRDFVFVDDLIDAYLLATSEHVQGNHIINIGTGVDTSFKDVIEIIEDLTQKKIKIIEGTYEKRSWSSGCWAADSHRARELLKWAPTHTLRQGIMKVLKWHCAQKQVPA